MAKVKIEPNYARLKKHFSSIDSTLLLKRVADYRIDIYKHDLLKKYCEQAGAVSALHDLCWFVLASSSTKALRWQQAAILNSRRVNASRHQQATAILSFFDAHGTDQLELTVKAKTLRNSKPLRIKDSGLISVLGPQIEDYARALLSKSTGQNKAGRPGVYSKYIRSEEACRVFSFIRGELQTSIRQAYFLSGVVLKLAGNPFRDRDGKVIDLSKQERLINVVKSAIEKFKKKTGT